MLARPAFGALGTVAAVALFSFAAAADPEAAGPAKAPPEALGNPQAGQFGDPNTGYFGNSAEGSFHNSQFPTVPPPSGATAAPAAPKLGQGSESSHVKLDAPSVDAKAAETPTADHGTSRKKKSRHHRTEPVS